MIPRIIHYCWFGRGEMPKLAVKCIESWRLKMPNYKIVEWNEETFDVASVHYVKQAYDFKKYAFVTDYVRLYALYTFGGVYMDTDVEVLKGIDDLLYHTAFSGFENNNYVPTGLIAAEKGSVWIKELMDQYYNRSFITQDGSMDLTTNTSVITDYMVKKGLIKNNTFQDFPGLCTLYPSDFFCPKDHATGLIKLTENTRCIHHFAGSWLDNKGWPFYRHKIKTLLFTLFSEGFANRVVSLFRGR